MSHLKRFATEDEYTSYYNSYNYVEPHVAVVGDEDNYTIKYQPETREDFGDIIYWDEKRCMLEKCAPHRWNKVLGTPVGIVAIPNYVFDTTTLNCENTRIIGLGVIDSTGSVSSSNPSMKWGNTGDTSLTNYTQLLCTNNAWVSSGYYPKEIEITSGVASEIDPFAQYSTLSSDSNRISSLYDSRTGKTEIYLPSATALPTSGVNAFKEINVNPVVPTQTLVDLGSSYTAANAAYKYEKGKYDLQWYLPTIAELACFLSRYATILNSFVIVGGNADFLTQSQLLWSSTEFDANKAFVINPSTGMIASQTKTESHRVLPFALLP